MKIFLDITDNIHELIHFIKEVVRNPAEYPVEEVEVILLYIIAMWQYKSY